MAFFAPDIAEALDASPFDADEIVGRHRLALSRASDDHLDVAFCIWPGYLGTCDQLGIVVLGGISLAEYSADGFRTGFLLHDVKGASRGRARRRVTMGMSIGPVQLSTDTGGTTELGISVPIGVGAVSVTTPVGDRPQLVSIKPNVLLEPAGSRRRAPVYIGWPERQPNTAEVNHFVNEIDALP